MAGFCPVFEKMPGFCPVFEKMPGFCPDFGLKLPSFARFLTFFARIRSKGPGSPALEFFRCGNACGFGFFRCGKYQPYA
jgi:hypothetical protein